MFNVYLENRYRCRAVVIRNFTASDLNQYIQLHDNRVTRVQFCKQASSVTVWNGRNFAVYMEYAKIVFHTMACPELRALATLTGICRFQFKIVYQYQ